MMFQTTSSKRARRNCLSATIDALTLTLVLAAAPASAAPPRLEKVPAIADDARGFAVRIPVGTTATASPQGWLVAPIGETGIAVVWQDAKDERALTALLGASTGAELGRLQRLPGEPVWRVEVSVPAKQAASIVATMDARSGTLLFFAPATDEGRAAALAMARAVLWGRPSSTYETTLGRTSAAFTVDPRWSLQKQADGVLAFRSTSTPGALIIGMQLASQEPPVLEPDPMPEVRWVKSGKYWNKRGVMGGQPAMIMVRVEPGATVTVIVTPPDPAAARAVLDDARIDAPTESARTAALRERLTGSAITYHFSAASSETYQLCPGGRFTSTSVVNNVTSRGLPGNRVTVHTLGGGADAGTWSIEEDADGVPTLTLAGEGGTTVFTPRPDMAEEDIRNARRVYASRPREKRPVAHLEVLGEAGGCS